MPDRFQSLEMIRREDGTQGDTIKLPEKSKMLERLIEASVEAKVDDADLRERFYPLLLKRGELITTSDGIVVFLAAALAEYGEMNPPPKVADLSKHAAEFIKALTPGAKDDERIAGIRGDALKRWNEAQLMKAKIEE